MFVVCERRVQKKAENRLKANLLRLTPGWFDLCGYFRYPRPRGGADSKQRVGASQMASTVVFGEFFYLKHQLTAGVFDLLAFQRNLLVGFQRGGVSGKRVDFVVLRICQAQAVCPEADASDDCGMLMRLAVYHDNNHGDGSASADEDTAEPREAYARFNRPQPGRPDYWDELPWAAGRSREA